MNILQIQDNLKNFSQDQLINEMQRPSGSAPQYLVLSEINRRKRVEADYNAAQAQDPSTVAEDAVASGGVPASGISGMAQAMAPRSESSLVAPQAPVGMASGGLMQFGNEIRDSMSQAINPYLEEIETEAESKFNIDLDNNNNMSDFYDNLELGNPMPYDPMPYLPMPNDRLHRPSFDDSQLYRPSRRGGKGFARPAMAIPFNEGGVIRAQQGTYFPSTPELYGIYGQESGFGKNLMGSSGEVGPYQIMPTTALMPGYGMLELFPEISAQIGKGKKYETAEQAYADNKEKINSILMSGEKTEPFVKSYLDEAEKKLGSRDLALLAYNQGIRGTEGFKGDPLDTDYVSGVKKILSGAPKNYGKESGEVGLMSAMASTLTKSDKDAAVHDSIYGYKGERSIKDDKTDNKTDDKKDDESGFFKDYVLGKRFGGKEKGFLDLIDEYVAGPTTKKFLQERRDLKEQNIEAEERGEFPPEKESELDKIKKLISGDSTGTTDADQALDLEGGVAEGISEIKDEDLPDPKDLTKPKKQPTDTQKETLPTLEEQLVAMQEDLKKNRNQDKWLAIAQAGLSIMASDKPTLGGAVGEGAGVGLQAYRDSQERYNEGVIDLLNARAKLKGKASTFGTKDILARMSAVDSDLQKTEENLQKALVESPADTEGHKRLKAQIRKLNNLRDNLSNLAGFKPYIVDSNTRKNTVSKASGA